ncbi:hypothetical protein F6X40_17415 [Paraburkholderia sp. UCT31]|nr:hypothetical protein [Paraburkholderia sp. UCT31]
MWLTEKPSQGADIARVLGAAGRKNGFIELKNGDKVTWTIGHPLQGLEPHEYNPAWKRWAWNTLPMIPEVWKNAVDKKKAGQVKVIKELLKGAQRVVIATDAGREGELIARETLEYCKFKGKIERLWTSVLTDAGIKTALANLLPNEAKLPLHEAALGRQHADFLWGINLTRAVTLAANTGEMFSVGRVQTPVLYLVVRLDNEVETFKAQTFYELVAEVKTANGHLLKLKHAPGEKSENAMRTEAEAKRRLELAKGATAPLRVETSPGADEPPYPYSMPALQKDASTAFGFSAAETLAVAQRLYNDLKVISYPRTDSQHLDPTLIPGIPAVLRGLTKMFPDAASIVMAKGPQYRKKVFDESQLTDHHAIVPTDNVQALSGKDLQLYTLIVERFLQVLAPTAEYDTTKVSMNANSVLFSTSGRVYRGDSWRNIKLLSR